MNTTRWKNKNIMRFATWNIKSLNNRDQETVKELNHNNIDTCAIQETQKKGRGQILYSQYIVVYSGVVKNERAKEGVAIAIKVRYRDCIRDCKYISSRILVVGLNTGHTKHKHTVNLRT